MLTLEVGEGRGSLRENFSVLPQAVKVSREQRHNVVMMSCFGFIDIPPKNFLSKAIILHYLYFCNTFVVHTICTYVYIIVIQEVIIYAQI